ncbi:HET-domain-containing protein [Stipitochalara longipes BDJ]|nr:HET-domain-containing protein [Stipitochalara longipes BDJ]
MTNDLDSPPHDQQEKDFEQWYQDYTAADGNDLYNNSPLIQVVNSDELNADFIEQQILESIPRLPIIKGFCIKCQDLFDNWPTLGRSSLREHDSKPEPDEEGWEYAVARPCTTYELEGATRSGCGFCAFLLQCLKDSEALETFRKIEARLYYLDQNATSSLSVQNWGTNPHQLLWLNLPGKVCTSCNSGIASVVKFDSCFLPASADCYEDPRDIFDIASNWFSTCSESHELCRSSEGVLPTRLISIAGESPRLVLSAECPERPRYATLSHSWGSHDVIKLLSENLDSYMEALPVERLPTTFNNAIEITRKLGLDYLWIDSLCIIQNSEADWQKESALMSSVYGGSALSIAASSARDSTHGCFLKPPHFSGGLRARITDGGRKRVQDFRSEDVYNLSTFSTHLGTRAWALQEKMLPPRTIHFGDRGAFWECRTHLASEYFPDGFSNMLVSPLVKRRGKFEWMWPQIVQLYSAANLTFGKDKLPALSGVARLGHNETGDQYLAGLWRDQIEEQLCWRRWQSGPDVKRPAWRAPSWSWAAVDGKVIWSARQTTILETNHAHVLEASTTPYADDPFGQVTGGIIRLACSSMIAGHLVPWTKSNKEGFNILLHDDKQEKEYPIQIDCLDDGEPKDTGPVYLLPILSGKTGTATGTEEKDWIYEMMIEGIVLRLTDVTKGEFSRIGSFNFYKDKVVWAGIAETVDESYEPFLKVMEEHGAVTVEAICAEIISNPEHPHERYVITLI